MQTRAGKQEAQSRSTPKKKFRIWSTAEREIVRKDIVQTWNSKGLRMLLIVVPVVMVVLLPIIFLLLISLLPESADGTIPQNLLSMLPDETAKLEYRQAVFSLFTTFLCPMFYLTVPIACSVSAASCTFVTEKESSTLETLILSPLGAKGIFNAKISGSVIFSVIISAISFLALTITISVGDIILSAPFFFNFEWFVTFLLLTPSVSLFCVIFVSLLTPRIHTTGESLQIMGYFILVIAVIYLLQFSGLFKINAAFLLIFAVLIIVADILLYNMSSRRFTCERLLTMDFFLGKYGKE